MLLLSHAALLVVNDLARWPFWTFVLLALAFASFFSSARAFERDAPVVLVLGVAVVLRLLLLPLPPTLSDDTLRYVWDGRVLSAGYNPYRWAPESPELAELRDDLWERMPHQEVPTVYPPLALGVFALATGLPQPLTGVKILLCFAEIVGCWLLLLLAAALGKPPGRAVWYCWNPLVTLEVAGMGHVDGLLVTAMVAAVYALVRGWPVRAGLAAAAGILTKLVPLVALPLWARHSAFPLGSPRGDSRRSGLFVAATAALLIAAVLPVFVALGGVPPGLVKYGISWEFNGPFYEPLWRLFDAASLDASVKSGLDRLKAWDGRHDFWNRFYPFVYPQLLAKVVLLALFAVLLVLIWRADSRASWPASLIAGSGRLFGAVLICSATLYPWYLLWLLPWAALARHPAWLALSVLVPLSYVPQLTAVPLFPWITLAIWGPFFLILGRSSWSID